MKPQLFRIITFCNFFLLTWKGLLHFTSGMNYSPLFEAGETKTLLFGFFLMVVGLISLFPLNYLRIGGLKSLYFLSTIILLLFALNEMIANKGTIERLFIHALEVLLPFSVFLHLTRENKKRNWKEILYFGLFFTLVGQSVLSFGLNGQTSYLSTSLQQLFSLSASFSKGLSLGIGITTILFSLILFVAQTRVIAFWYLTIYGVLFTIGGLWVGSLTSQTFAFYTIDFSMALTRLPMLILPLYFLARTYNWKWALPTGQNFVKA